MSEEKLVKITVDGQEIEVPVGSTVLEAARKLGIEIPRLCHHEALSMQASCRICLVEMSVERRGRTYNWVDASCVYPVQEGLVVKTDTKKIRKERKIILELLL